MTTIFICLQYYIILTGSCCIPAFSLPNQQSRSNIQLKGLPGSGYFATLAIGTPQQFINALVDTGSSNLAVAGFASQNIENYFNSTASFTYKSSGISLDVKYTVGEWHGSLGEDYVTLPNVFNGSVRTNIALIQSANQFFVNNSGWQGILGLAYKAISRPNGLIKPAIDSFYEAGLMDNSFSLLLCGTEDTPVSDVVPVGGIMTLGKVDPALYTGSLYAAAIVEESYYKIVLTDIKVGNVSLGFNCQEYNNEKSIVDSGTTNLRLPSKVFEKIVGALKIKVSNLLHLNDAFWMGDYTTCIWHNATTDFFEVFPFISMNIMATDHLNVITLEISPEQYLRAVPASKYQDCYKLAISSSSSGTVLGAVIMEGFYVNFDRTRKEIMFAKTTCKARKPKSVRSYVANYSVFTRDPIDCVYIAQTIYLPSYAIALIVFGSLFFTTVMILIFYKCVKHYKRSRRQAQNDVIIANLIQESFDTEY